MTSEKATLIVFGGFAGTGKTTISGRLSSELGIPRLGSDALRGIVRSSRGINGGGVNAGWLAYDVLFSLCEEFLKSGVSTIIDTNLGHAFIWQWLDGIRARYSEVAVLPIVLRCPLDVCLQRIQARYESDSIGNAPSDLFLTNPAIVAIWDYLSQIDRPDVQLIDAARPLDTVYRDVLDYINLHRIQGCTRVDWRAVP